MCARACQCVSFTPNRLTGDEIRLLKAISQIWNQTFVKTNNNHVHVSSGHVTLPHKVSPYGTECSAPETPHEWQKIDWRQGGYESSRRGS